MTTAPAKGYALALSESLSRRSMPRCRDCGSRLDRQARDAARTGLRDARDHARAALVERLLEQHADALAAAEDAAEAAWRDANPALAALLGDAA